MAIATIISALPSPWDGFWKVVWWILAAIAFVYTTYSLWAKEHAKVIELETRLQEIAKRRQLKDALARYHGRLEMLINRISAQSTSFFDSDRQLEQNAAATLSEAAKFIHENIGLAEAEIFSSTADCKWTPTTKEAGSKQWWIDVLNHARLKVRALIEDIRA